MSTFFKPPFSESLQIASYFVFDFPQGQINIFCIWNYLASTTCLTLELADNLNSHSSFNRKLSHTTNKVCLILLTIRLANSCRLEKSADTCIAVYKNSCL